MRHGAYDYLAKPIDLNKLLASIRETQTAKEEIREKIHPEQGLGVGADFDVGLYGQGFGDPSSYGDHRSVSGHRACQTTDCKDRAIGSAGVDSGR